jgi:predicted XRE-type DNA-binding protein
MADGMNSRNQKAVHFGEGSGNVFADLGLEDSGELYTRAQIGIHVFKTIKDRKLKRRQIAEILGITQRDVSHLMNGHFSRFTGDKLREVLKRLGNRVRRGQAG